MNKKRIPVWSLIVGMLSTLVIGFGIGMGADRLMRPKPAIPTAQNARLNAVYQSIKDNYYKETDDTKLIDGAIQGMMGSLKDPYSEYLIGSDKDNLDAQISASFGGIGAGVQQTGDSLIISNVIPDTPAQKAGIKAGDVLTKVDGKSVKGLTVSEAVNKIRGKVGSKVTLTLDRGGKSLEFELVRAKITDQTVTGQMSTKDKSVGIIKISSFSDPTTDQFKSKVKDLREKGAKSFVIDLRGNPGGALTTVSEIASMLLKDDQIIFSVETRNQGSEEYKAGKDLDKGFKVTEPIAVLVDESSASASEILAAALKEDRDAPIIGTKTYGKGVVQNVAPLDDTHEMKLTTAKWLTPKGNWIHGKGVTPTIKVAYPAYYDLRNIETMDLMQGTSGKDVQRIKRALNAVGYKLGDDANFNSAMTAALKDFQKKSKLPETGVADQTTLIALMGKINEYFIAHDAMMNKALEVLK